MDQRRKTIWDVTLRLVSNNIHTTFNEQELLAHSIYAPLLGPNLIPNMTIKTLLFPYHSL